MTTIMVMNLFNIKNVNMNIKCLYIATSKCTPYASITHNILALVSILVSDAWL